MTWCKNGKISVENTSKFPNIKTKKKSFSMSHCCRWSYQLIIPRCNIFAMLRFCSKSNVISPNQFNHFIAY